MSAVEDGRLPGEESASGEAPGARMSFLEHLDELRARLFRAALAVAVGLVVGFYYSDEILAFLLAPVQDAMGTLAVTRPAEAFMNKMKAAMVGAIVLALPYLFFQLWGFISPGLYRREKRWVWPVVISGTLLFGCGVGFCYIVAMPTAVGFLAEQSKAFTNVVTVDSAFSFSSKLLLGAGAVFELPLVIFALARLRLVSAKLLWKRFDIAFLVIFIIAAVITPTPDVITQTVFALPMIGLYVLSIFVAWFARPRDTA